MSLDALIVSRSRLFLSAALLLTLVGAGAWLTMPRQEDPEIPARGALIVTPFPGASAATVERLVVEPLEEELGQIDEIKTIATQARAGVAVTVIELRDDVTDVDPVYDEVARHLEAAVRDFPATAMAPILDRQAYDQESIVIAALGADDPRLLADAIDRLEHRLLALSEVSRTIVTADPGEQITIGLDDATAARLGLDPRLLAAQLAARNGATPGGTIALGGRTVTVEPRAEFASLTELVNAPIVLASGSAVPLGELAEVTRGVAEPVSERMRWNGGAAVALGVVPRAGINLLDFGARVQAVVDEVGAEVAPLRFEMVAFQPERVESRLAELGRSLLSGVAVVALVLFLFMGPRLGLTVASIVPLVTLSSLAIYAMAGGVLHQMSIAAFVLALGLLVDNAIVVAENVQARIDGGAARWDAARAAIRELALPLGTATGTTVAAFVPMLLSQGPTGDFTRALPIVIILTLTVSWVIAVTVTPAVSAMVLRPSARRAARAGRSRVLGFIAGLAARRPGWVLLGVLLLLGAAGSLVPNVRSQFFPASDRNQLIVDIALPEGAHLDETDRAAQAIEAALLEREEVVSVAAFVGRGVPHFYYNLPHKPSQPHFAQLVVTTRTMGDVDTIIEATRRLARERTPGVEVIGRRIEQGPPVSAPVELRVYGDEPRAVRAVAQRLTATLRETAGAEDVRNDLGTGTPTIRYQVHDAVASLRGLSRDDVALALLGHTRGLPIGELRSGDDPVPIVVRGGAGEWSTPATLASASVSAPGVPPTPLAQLATEEVDLEPAAIFHRNRQRVHSVFAQLAPGATFSDVMAGLGPVLSEPLPAGVRVEVGGDAEASGDSNAALLTALPIGLMLLLVFLMGEFNSFRRVGIVMATVPLAAVGVVPGLALSGQPFGFTSMLGVFALIGIVVNNAIVLLDLIGRRREEGADVAEALRDAVLQRTRPILLTTGTTVAGLLPLATSESTMWPPLAWSMISGLLASTLLTLLAIPALYRVLHRDAPRDTAGSPGTPGTPRIAGALAASLVLIGLLSTASAQEREVLGLDEALAAVEVDGFAMRQAALAVERAALLDEQADALWRPRLDATAAYTFFDDEALLELPDLYGPIVPYLAAVAAADPRLPSLETQLGAVDSEPRVVRHQHDVRGTITAQQPLFQPLARPLRRQAEALRREAEAGRGEARFALREAVRTLYFEALAQQRIVEIAGANVALAELDLRRVRAAAAEDVASEFEVNRAEVALARAEQDRDAAETGYRLLVDALAEVLAREPSFDLEAPRSFGDGGATGGAEVLTAVRRDEQARALAEADRLRAAADGVRAEGLPMVVLEASATGQRETAFDDPATWYVRVGLQWSLYDGGSRRVRREQAELEARAAALRAEEVEVRAEAELRRAVESLDLARRAVRVAQREVELARRNVEVTLTAWQVGAAGFVDVEAAREQLLAAEVGLATAEVREVAGVWAVRHLRGAEGE
jgi:multidrug efflux pump subunit AcrB/outer membrane protein TolC